MVHFHAPPCALIEYKPPVLKRAATGSIPAAGSTACWRRRAMRRPRPPDLADEIRTQERQQVDDVVDGRRPVVKHELSVAGHSCRNAGESKNSCERVGPRRGTPAEVQVARLVRRVESVVGRAD